MNRRYAIVGTGALGGFYGARLQRAGVDVHFLLHSDYQHVKQHGLVVESVDGNFALPQVQAYEDVNQMPACDVVAIALKTTENYLLSQLLPPIVKPDGVVLVLQNGLGIEASVAGLVHPTRVIGGLCFLCANKVGPGHIHHLDYGKIKLGEYVVGDKPAGITKQMEQITQDLESAEISVQQTEDLLLARWQKLMWNIPFNGLSVLLNAQTNELMENRHTYALAERLMQEVAAAAAGYGRTISPHSIQALLDYTAEMKPYQTSMKIDYDNGRLMEVETMYGNPLRAAQAVRVAVPRIAMLYQQLAFLNASLGNNRTEKGGHRTL